MDDDNIPVSRHPSVAGSHRQPRPHDSAMGNERQSGNPADLRYPREHPQPGDVGSVRIASYPVARRAGDVALTAWLDWTSTRQKAPISHVSSVY